MEPLFCLDRGWCAAHDTWLPSLANDYHWVTMRPIIGCNRLRCRACGELVRSALGRTPPAGADAPAVFDALAHPETLAEDRWKQGRLYGCRCHFTVVFASFSPSTPQSEADEQLPWSCDGHPQLTLPATVDGLALDDTTDWTALVRDGLAAHWKIALHPNVDDRPGFLVERLYYLLIRLPAADAIARATLQALAHDDARKGALRFFAQSPRAAGADELAPLIDAHPEWLASPLREQIIATLTDRLRPDALGPIDDAAARALLHRIATAAPGVPGDVVYTLVADDAAWAAASVAALVRAMPDRWRSLLGALAQGPIDALVRGVRAAADSDVVPAAELRAFVEELPEPARAKALSAIR